MTDSVPIGVLATVLGLGGLAAPRPASSAVDGRTVDGVAEILRDVARRVEDELDDECLLPVSIAFVTGMLKGGAQVSPVKGQLVVDFLPRRW